MNIGKEQFFLTGIQNCEGEKLIFVQLCAVLSTTRCISLRRGILIDYVEPQYVVVTDVMTYYILCFTWAGVLFLDELPEYQRPVLEALRQPLEDGFVTVSRVRARTRYQARCMLVASMNPCPCGYHGSRVRPCRCNEHEIAKYLERISGPLLDRIDLQVETDAVPVDEISSAQKSESSAAVRERVQKARAMQVARFSGTQISSNAQAEGSAVTEFFPLSIECSAVILKAVDKLHLSMRAYTRVIKVARTIADLAGEKEIAPAHLLEAVSYRTLDNKYWGR